jgi:RNA polymerase sigma factor (sigma-70 family)
MSEAAAAAGFSRLLSDERLTRRAVGGDERAFAAIFRRYHQSLYRFCLAIVGNSEDAQDALQNTMMKVLRALPGEERKIELKPWLYRIAHNESIDLLRRRRETRELDAEAPAPGYGLAEDAATRERLRRLLADLRELPERQREVLVMRELAGLDFEEIGTALDTSGAVARQTLYEARQSLRQMEEGREMSCADVTKALSDGDGRVTRRRDVRAHLRSCAGCRGFRDEIKDRQHDLAALSPLPAVAAAGMLQGLVGGTQAATGGGLAAVLGGGAAKTIGAGAAAKGVATVAVVAAVGVTAADRSGMIDVGLPGGGGGKSSEATPGGGGSSHSQSGVGNGVPAGDGGGSGAGAGAGVQGEGGREKADEGAKNGASSQPGAPGKGEAKGHEEARQNGKPHTDAKPQPGAQGPPLEHPTGRNEEKQTPDAAAGGQETAEANKPPPREEGGAGKEGGQGATPPKASPDTPRSAPPDSPKGAPPDSPKSAPPSSPPSSPPSQGAPPKAPPANPPASPPSPSPQPQPQPKGPPEAAPESSGGSGGPGNSGGHGKPADPGNSGGKKP